MRPQPIRRAVAGSIPAALRSRASLRTICATALAATIGLAPAIMIASPAAALPGDPGVYSIADKTAVEGNNLAFTITRQGNVAGLPEETISWTASSVGLDTATAGQDYTAATGTVKFPATTAGSTAATNRSITVVGLQDTADELDEETFTVTLSGSILIDDATATGTITDDDTPTYTLTAVPSTVSEGANGGNPKAIVTAKLSAKSLYPVTIPVSTEDGTAKEGQDFEPVDETLVIPPDSLTASVEVSIIEDAIDEADTQTFKVVGAAGTRVAGTQSVSINITDNDAPPVLTLTAPGLVAEGDDLTIVPHLDGQSENTITAKWVTADGPAGTPTPGNGTATAGKDYTAVTDGTLTFAPLATTPTVPIKVKTLTDSLDEVSPEDFSVKLSAPTNATLGTTASVTGGITDDVSTPLPSVSLLPNKILEGAPGAKAPRTFTVKLDKASGRTHKVHYVVAAGVAGPGVATEGEDFADITGDVTFKPGDTEKTFTVDVYGDNIDEGTGETFTVTLSQDVATLEDGGALTAEITITDDDDKPVLSVTKTSVTQPEGDENSVVMYGVKLSNPSSEDIAFSVVDSGTGNASAATIASPPSSVGSDDYELISDSPQTIVAGKTNGQVIVVVNGDKVYESDETAKFAVSRDDDHASGPDVDLTLTLKNDDTVPVFTVTSTSGTEGDSVEVSGTVVGQSQVGSLQDIVLLDIMFAGGSVAGSRAASADDFTNPGKVPVIFYGGAMPGTVIPIGTVKLTDDTSYEPSETIVVSGTAFAGAATVVPGTITITDNDVAPPVVKPTLMAPPYRQGVGAIDLTGKVAANADVDLWAAPVGGGNLTKVTSTKANASGDYKFTRQFTNRGQRFQTSASGLSSSVVTVLLRHDPVLVASSPRKKTAVLRVTGDPKLAGLKVKFELLTEQDGWKKFGGDFTTNDSGIVIATFDNLNSGATYKVRAYIEGNDGWGLETGYSGPRTVKIM